MFAFIKRRSKSCITLGYRKYCTDVCLWPSAANEAAIKSYNAEHGTSIEIRQIKYLNNIVEQDHRAVKRVTRPMMGFKSFESAQCTLTGIELMHMIRKGQLEGDEFEGLTVVEQLYALVL